MKKGQLSIMNLLTWVILLVVGAVLTPLINGMMAPLIAATNDSLEKIVLHLPVIGLWLMIVMVLLIYATPRGGTQQIY